jgi:thioredoxin 2
VTELSDLDFDRTIGASPLPVVVDFWAPGCAPCLALAPSFAELAGAYRGRALFAKVRVDACPRTRDGRGVTHIPTVAVFVGGREVARLVDPSRAELAGAVEASLAGGRQPGEGA